MSLLVADEFPCCISCLSLDSQCTSCFCLVAKESILDSLSDDLSDNKLLSNSQARFPSESSMTLLEIPGIVESAVVEGPVSSPVIIPSVVTTVVPIRAVCKCCAK